MNAPAPVGWPFRQHRTVAELPEPRLAGYALRLDADPALPAARPAPAPEPGVALLAAAAKWEERGSRARDLAAGLTREADRARALAESDARDACATEIRRLVRELGL